jgi:hypothetical protein
MKRFDDLLDTSEAIDTEAQYRDFLREAYRDCLSGPFEHLDPAELLEEADPVAYRCGHVDYIDGEPWTEYNGDTYETSYLESIREELDYELNAEIDELQNDLDEYDFDGVDEETGEQHRETIEAEVSALRAEIDSLYRLF